MSSMGPKRSTQSLPIDGVGVSDLKIDSGSVMACDVKRRGCWVSASPLKLMRKTYSSV